MEIYTTGFAGKTAAEFFGALKENGIKLVIDIRLNNSSQLAGFTKRTDLPYFLRELCNASYIHNPNLAPTQEILDAFKKEHGSWQEYESSFNALLAERKIEELLNKDDFSEPVALLCSENKPTQCHRRLVAEYLKRKWDGLEIIHL